MKKWLGVIFFFACAALCADPCVFVDPPENVRPQFEVAGCFCEHQGKVLLMLRHPEKPQGNSWCVPGGKLENGETPIEAVIREVKEETGLKLRKKILKYCQKVFVRFPHTEFVLHIFRSKLKNIPEELAIAPQEHSSYRWVTVDEALQMPLIAGGDDCLRLAFLSDGSDHPRK